MSEVEESEKQINKVSEEEEDKEVGDREESKGMIIL